VRYGAVAEHPPLVHALGFPLEYNLCIGAHLARNAGGPMNSFLLIAQLNQDTSARLGAVNQCNEISAVQGIYGTLIGIASSRVERTCVLPDCCSLIQLHLVNVSRSLLMLYLQMPLAMFVTQCSQT
jgi:hypothetical protein